MMAWLVYTVLQRKHTIYMSRENLMCTNVTFTWESCVRKMNYNNVYMGKCVCSSVRYNTHLYRLAVQARFYRDAIECWISMQETLV